MPTTVTTIDKGDFICWVTQDTDGRYIVWDVGVAQSDCHSRAEWAQIKFKKLGFAEYPIHPIVMTPIDSLDFTGDSSIEEKIRKQQGKKCWCIRFKEM